MKEYMKKYQIVSKWNTQSALQILEINSTPKNNFVLGKIVFFLIIAIFFYNVFIGTRHINSINSKKEIKELSIPAPILNMKNNIHAAEDLNTLSDL